jgi:membrane-associated phospholipid phosphatase
MVSAPDVRAHKRIAIDPVAGLRVAGWLAKWPLIGLFMVLSGSLVFGALAFSLQNRGPLLKWDVPFANSMHVLALHSPAYVKDLMIAGFYIGKQVVTAIAMILIGYFLYKQFWRELAMVVIGFGGGGALWLILSTIFNRHRPVFDHQIWIVLKGGGFPSGHTLNAVVSYGFLAYLFSSNLRSRFWKWATGIIAIGIMLFIGYSRLFLGDHYLSDVVAGYAFGIFWSGLVYTLVEIFWEKRRNRHVEKNRTKTR